MPGALPLRRRRLGQTKAVVSFNVRQLETELGVTLFLRSTRPLTLTEAGAVFFQRRVYAIYPDAQHVPTKVRAFIDFLRERLA
jgi:DNA-binding transcriptional LysR family regulator